MKTLQAFNQGEGKQIDVFVNEVLSQSFLLETQKQSNWRKGKKKVFSSQINEQMAKKIVLHKSPQPRLCKSNLSHVEYW